MAGKDKVKFGIKNVHYALLTDETTPTFETPVAIPGAVSFSLEANGDSSPFYADDMQYFVTVANNGYTGDLEMALFQSQFLEDIFGYTASEKDKVVTENAKRSHCYLKRKETLTALNMCCITASAPGLPVLWLLPQRPPNRRPRPSA